MYKEDGTQSRDPDRTSYSIHHPPCHTVFYKLLQNSKITIIWN